jgi:HPt (histidine-containing phosphotransfer) domain-containing protein
MRARENGGTRVPIVAMTAGAMAGDRQRALDAGMDDYMTKPLRADHLDAVLERWAGGAVPPTGEADRPLVDDSRVRRFLADYPDIVDRLVALFEETTPPLLDELTEAAARDDEAAVDSLAHKLRGSLQNIGADQMAAVCRALEVPGARHAPLVEELRALYAPTLDEIHAALGASRLI